MRIISALILVFWAAAISAAAADYSQLAETYESYQPPKPPSYERMTAETQRDAQIAGSAMIEQMDRLVAALKTKHERYLEQPPALDFLKLDNTGRLADLKAVAEDIPGIADRIGGQLVLEDIEILAVLRNPSVLSARRKVAAGIQSFSQVQGLEIELKQFSAFTEALTPGAGPVKMTESARLKRGYPSTGALKAQVVDHQVAILTHQLFRQGRDVVTDVRKAFWQYAYNVSAIQITTETIAALERLRSVATSLYRGGRTSFQDVIKINIRIALLSEQLVSLQRQERTLGVDLLTLLDLPQDIALGEPAAAGDFEMPGTAQDLAELAQKYNPELNVMREKVAKTQKMVQIAETMILPDYTFNLSLSDDKAVQSVGSDAGKPAFPEKPAASMSNGLPSRPWFGIDAPWLLETREQLKSLQLQLADLENQTAKKIEAGWFKADKASRERLLYENQILGLSVSALKVSTSEYESGAIPFSQAIGSYTDWLNVRLDIARKKMQVQTEIAMLAQAVGRSL